MIVFVAAVFLLVTVAQQGKCAEVCQTPACINSAARVTESMNVGPCENFYEFACRGWIMKNPIPLNEHRIDVLQLMMKEIQMKLHKILDARDNDNDGKPIKLARALYRTCMDEGSINGLGIKPLLDTLTKLGLPHAPPTDEEVKNLDIMKIAGSANRLYNIGIFFFMNINQNFTDSTKNQLTILQKSPGFGNFERILRQPTLFRRALLVQRNKVKNIFVFGGSVNKSEEYTTEIMDLMTKIAEIMGTPAERANQNYSGSVVTIDKLQEMTDPHGDTWNWTKYFKALFEETDIIVDPKTDNVLLYDVSYTKHLISLIKETPLGITARYIWWEIVNLYWQRLHDSFSKQQRWQVCIQVVNTYFESALTAAYVEKHFDVEYKKKAMEMWADINSSLDEMIDELDWMDAETKAHAHVKLHAVKAAIGYQDWITNPEELNKYYEPFEVLEGRLFDTYTRHQLIWGRRLLNSWKQRSDKKHWPIAGASLTIKYERQANTVVFTAGLLQLPVYGNGVESLNYGAIGMLIGSQIMQTIDDLGGERDENGNLRRWWSEKTTNNYLEKAGCIMKQYTDLVITHEGHHFKLNGSQIRRGSMATIAGLKIAFRAYQKFKARSEPQQVLPTLDKFTDEQLLFLSFAQMFCASETVFGLNQWIGYSSDPPYRYIVMGVLQNNDEFAKAWNCSHDSPMNPKKTCTTVW